MHLNICTHTHIYIASVYWWELHHTAVRPNITSNNNYDCLHMMLMMTTKNVNTHTRMAHTAHCHLSMCANATAITATQPNNSNEQPAQMFIIISKSHIMSDSNRTSLHNWVISKLRLPRRMECACRLDLLISDDRFEFAQIKRVPYSLLPYQP